jgi:hypothetical protein
MVEIESQSDQIKDDFDLNDLQNLKKIQHG